MTRGLIASVGFCAAAVVASGCADEPFTGGGGSDSGGAGGGAGSGAGNAGGGDGGSAQGGSPSSGGSPGAGGAVCQSLGQPCADCAFDACEAEYCACYGVQDCAALVNCFQGCGDDPPCQQGCMTAHPDSISQAFLLGGCAYSGCSAVCVGVEAQNACNTCLFTSCDTEMNACLANADCAAILLCVQDNCAPTDQPCALGCAEMYPAGQAEAFPVSTCLSRQCQSDC